MKVPRCIRQALENKFIDHMDQNQEIFARS